MNWIFFFQSEFINTHNDFIATINFCLFDSSSFLNAHFGNARVNRLGHAAELFNLVDMRHGAQGQRVVAMAGRFAQPPRLVPDGTALHFIHGEQDPVIAPAFSVAAAERLRALGATARVDLLPGLGHGIDGRVLALLSAALDPDLEA